MVAREEREMMDIKTWREIFNLLLEFVIVGGWLYLVYTGKAGVEGFIVIATYIVKKKYDMKDEVAKNGG